MLVYFAIVKQCVTGLKINAYIVPGATYFFCAEVSVTSNFLKGEVSRTTNLTSLPIEFSVMLPLG